MQPPTGSHGESEDQPKGELRSERGFVYSRYGIVHERIKVQDVREYLNNEAMIKQLHEEKEVALEAIHRQRDEFEEAKRRCQNEINELRSFNQDLKLMNQRLRDGLGEAARSSSKMFGLQVLAVVLLGIGINVLTSNPLWTPWFWLGFALVVGGVVVEYVAFRLKPEKGAFDG